MAVLRMSATCAFGRVGGGPAASGPVAFERGGEGFVGDLQGGRVTGQIFAGGEEGEPAANGSGAVAEFDVILALALDAGFKVVAEADDGGVDLRDGGGQGNGGCGRNGGVSSGGGWC